MWGGENQNNYCVKKEWLTPKGGDLSKWEKLG